MQLSKRTTDLLKNFAAINGNILIKKGKTLSTIATIKNIMATVSVEEDFPNEIGIFNLNELLGVLSLMDSPEIDFEQKQMVLKEGRSKMRYVYADPSILIYPQKDIKNFTENVTFELSSANIVQMQKAGSALGVQDVAFIGDGEKIVAQVIDKKSDSSNQYTVDLEAETTEKFTVYFRLENFKMISDNYTVGISSNNISKFVGENYKVTYYIACEADSKFD